MSPRVTLPKEEEGVDVDGANQDGVEREGEAVDSIFRVLNCASLHLMVAVSMAHMTKKWAEEGKGTKKWLRSS